MTYFANQLGQMNIRGHLPGITGVRDSHRTRRRFAWEAEAFTRNPVPDPVIV